MLESLHINDFIAQSSIKFIAMAWQVEYLLPLYGQPMQEKREAS